MEATGAAVLRQGKRWSEFWHGDVGNLQAVTSRSPSVSIHFAGLPVVAAFVGVTAAAAIWIGLSLTAVGTVSETLSMPGSRSTNPASPVRPLPATLPP